MKNCETCNDQFTPKNSRQKFCSKKCQLVHWKNKNREHRKEGRKWNYRAPSVGIIKCKTCGNDFKPKINHPRYIYCSDKCRGNNPVVKEYRKQWVKNNPERTLINRRRATAKRTKRMREDSVLREKVNKRNRERVAFRKEAEPGFREKITEKNKQWHIKFAEKNGKHYNSIQRQLQKKNDPEKYEAWRQKCKEARKRREAENPELYKLKQSLRGKAYYYANKEHVLKRTREYAQNLPEGTKAKWQREWRKNNPEKEMAKRQRYIDRHPGIQAMHTAAYRAQKIKATPKWLTEEQHKQIAEIYATCPKDCDVDHVVPLRGKNVSGLHVPWNLEHMEKLDNMSKGNRLGKKYEKQLQKSKKRWGFSGGGLV